MAGLRVGKDRRSHWTKSVTDLDYSNHCCDIHSAVSKPEKMKVGLLVVSSSYKMSCMNKAGY